MPSDKQDDSVARSRAMMSVLEDLKAEREKLAEENKQRKAAEAYARAIVESALDAVVSMDSSGCITDWNAQAEALFGWTHAEAVGCRVADLIIPEDQRESHHAGLRRYLETGRSRMLGERLEVTAVKQDGETCRVELSVVAVTHSGAVHFHAFVRDITQRSLDAEYRARLAAIVESSYDAIIGKNIDGTIISWNAGAERIYGFSEEEAIGKTVEIILPPGQTVEEREVRLAMETGQRLEQFETVRRRKDGQLIHVSVTVSPIADDEGVIIGSSTVERDVSDRKRIEEAEAEQRRLLTMRGDVSAALASAHDVEVGLQQAVEAVVDNLDLQFACVWAKDIDDSSLTLRSKAGTGVRAEPIARVKVGDGVVGGVALGKKPLFADFEPNVSELDDLDWVKSSDSHSVAFVPLALDHRVLGVLAMFSNEPLSNALASQLSSIATSLAQYIDRRQYEEQLRRANEAAQRASKARMEFLANVSHELRTPMNAIIGMTQLALGSELDKEVRDYLETSQDSAQSLLALLDDILDFSKLDAGKFKIEETAFALRDAVDDTVKALAPRAFEKGLELLCEIDPRAPDNLVGDSVRIRQVLTNLVSNAVKFTETGEVSVAVNVVRKWPHEVRLKFVVSDTGIGISDEDQSRILEPFTQVDASSTREHGGAGLGLAICRELLHLMGSKLSVKSKPRKGSKFSFVLTLKRDHTKDSVEFSPLEHFAEMPVLVVDDNDSNRRIVCKMLSDWSIPSDAAASVQEALALLERSSDRKRPYRLLFIDATMPEANRLLGYGAENGPGPANCILMVATAQSEAFNAHQLSPKPSALLRKPISQSDVFDVVMQTIDGPVKDAGGDEIQVAPCAPGDALSVLLVEDTPANQKVVKAILAKRGHRVTVAENGREAVTQCQSTRFDVILMDVQMPVMDGYQATAAIRALENPLARATPIVAMTAHAMRGDRERCLEAGMDSYVAKPVDVNQLTEVVETIGCIDRPENGEPKPADGERKLSCESKEKKRMNSVIDYKGVMQRLAGDKDLFRDFISYFDEDSPGLLNSLKEAVADDDPSRVQRAAHSLKGLAANFGAVNCSAAAYELELCGKSSDLTNAGSRLKQLEEEIRKLDAALDEYRSA